MVWLIAAMIGSGTRVCNRKSMRGARSHVAWNMYAYLWTSLSGPRDPSGVCLNLPQVLAAHVPRQMAAPRLSCRARWQLQVYLKIKLV